MSGLNVQYAELIEAPGEGISTGKGTIHQAIKDRDFWQAPAVQTAKALKEGPDTQKFNAGNEELPERCQEERRAVLQLRPHREFDIEPVELKILTYGHDPIRPGRPVSVCPVRAERVPATRDIPPIPPGRRSRAALRSVECYHCRCGKAHRPAPGTVASGGRVAPSQGTTVTGSPCRQTR